MTLPAEEIDLTDIEGRRLWLFRKYRTVIRIPSILRWDGGPELTREDGGRTKEQIAWALRQLGERHEFVVDDDFEERFAARIKEVEDSYGKASE